MKENALKKCGITLQGRLALILFVQMVLILMLWFHYHSTSLEYVNQTIHNTAERSAERLLRDLSDELEYMKAVCSVIAGSDNVKEFLRETDTAAYYEKAITVSELVDRVAFPISSTDSIVAINDDGRSYRFSGGVSNRSCQQLYNTFRGAGAVYAVIELDGVNYFCHNSPVISTNEYKSTHLGNIIMLTDLSKTRRLLETDVESDVDLLIVDDGVVLLSSRAELEGKRQTEIKALYSRMMFTPMQSTGTIIGAAIRGEAANAERVRFLGISFFIIGLMLVAVFLIYRYLSRGMVRPMTSIFKDVHSIENGNERLQPTGRQDFDALVAEINSMLDRTKRYHMELLGKQINVHFIVNTLLYIQGLSSSGENEKATLATGALIKLIRHMNVGDANVNIFVEMELVQSYVSLMNIKHDDRFLVSYDVDDRLAEYLMPGFVLQPIVENAMTHGLGAKMGDCKLSITGVCAEKTAILQVSDNGFGMEKAPLLNLREKLALAPQGEFTDASPHGVALYNIQRRIHLLYGNGYGIQIESEPAKGTTVTITLPLQKDSQ